MIKAIYKSEYSPGGLLTVSEVYPLPLWQGVVVYGGKAGVVLEQSLRFYIWSTNRRQREWAWAWHEPLKPLIPHPVTHLEVTVLIVQKKKWLQQLGTRHSNIWSYSFSYKYHRSTDGRYMIYDIAHGIKYWKNSVSDLDGEWYLGEVFIINTIFRYKASILAQAGFKVLVIFLLQPSVCWVLRYVFNH